ncbi:MAG: tRNA (adenosine(37)-N6)-threonylcarbamoyltransferase complex ATPase subunit type 1 TsaE [Candidatus Gastranaerophilales bacterium]|nr:tRNA (adenosine(37)-N6)-threonylcarbamoyltransferase complex ATPase subunit type 1 TsaE [Candidatus Gastranaerophilales bacterium]
MSIEDRKPIIKTIHSVEETAALASRFAKILKKGDILLFTGEIGAGKTTFIQALAKNLGVKELVTSPTFVIHMLRDSGRIPLSHVDLYRLNNDVEVESIGFEEYYDTAVTVVEWADRYSGFEPPYLELHFAYGEQEEERIISILPNGGDWGRRLQDIIFIDGGGDICLSDLA